MTNLKKLTLKSIKCCEACDFALFFYHSSIETFNEYFEKVRSLEKENTELRMKLEEYQCHNARNAGRKLKATPEQTKDIALMHDKGMSYYKIAYVMTERTGVKWNKSTVRNTYERYENEKLPVAIGVES